MYSQAVVGGANVTPTSALAIADAYACVRALADAAASIPLIAYQRTMQGPVTNEDTAAMTDLTLRERVVIAPVLLLIVVLGLFPGPLLAIIDPAVAATLEQVGVSDPEPDVPAVPAAATPDAEEESQ